MDQMLAAPLPADLEAELAKLAARYHRANSPVIRLMNRLGGGIETQLSALPAGVMMRIEALVAEALARSYGLAGGLAGWAPDLGQRAPMLAAMATGAAGGAGGLATSLAELPVTVTLFLTAIRQVAAAHGHDPEADWVKVECLQVFAAGSPIDRDDGVNTAFVSARLALTGATVQNLIAAIAPKLAVVLGQKLAAQAVPILGALSGAALNAAYLSYYRELAHLRFALRKLGETHGSEAVETGFRLAVTPPTILRA